MLVLGLNELRDVDVLPRLTALIGVEESGDAVEDDPLTPIPFRGRWGGAAIGEERWCGLIAKLEDERETGCS